MRDDNPWILVLILSLFGMAIVLSWLLSLMYKVPVP